MWNSSAADLAAMVSNNTILDLPELETPVNTVNFLWDMEETCFKLVLGETPYKYIAICLHLFLLF